MLKTTKRQPIFGARLKKRRPAQRKQMLGSRASRDEPTDDGRVRQGRASKLDAPPDALHQTEVGQVVDDRRAF